MFSLFKKIFKVFSIYATSFEKKTDQFIKSIHDNSDKRLVKQALLSLMKEDLIGLLVWLERRYKGYNYLKKKKRLKLYSNSYKIKNEFERFTKEPYFNDEDLFSSLLNFGLSRQLIEKDFEKFKYLFLISIFFKKVVNYKYQEATNFGELLKNPINEELIGDCNQIVSLYVFLYGSKFDINDLELKVFSSHVCLHFKGIDMESTKGEFTLYKEEGMKVINIVELIAINILDISDMRVHKIDIVPKTFLEATKIAFLISSEREIVSKNLIIAYKNLAIDCANNKKHKDAIYYAKKVGDSSFINQIAGMLVDNCIKSKSFYDALKFSEYSSNNEIRKNVIKSHGIHYYNQKDYTKAINQFKKIGDSKLIKACYEQMYIKLQKRIISLKTKKEFIGKKNVLYKMKEYSIKAGNSQMIEQNKKLIEFIS